MRHIAIVSGLAVCLIGATGAAQAPNPSAVHLTDQEIAKPFTGSTAPASSGE